MKFFTKFCPVLLSKHFETTHNRSATEGFGTKVSAAKSDLSWGLLLNQMLDDSLFKVAGFWDESVWQSFSVLPSQGNSLMSAGPSWALKDCRT